MDPSPQLHPRSAATISAVVVVNIMWWMVMIAAIGMGATHLTRCPVQSLIPIYLIVMGVGSLLSLSLTYTIKTWTDGAVYILSSVCMSLLHIFSFCWFITGSVWVYSVYPPSYSPTEDRYCHRITYMFAFVVTTVVWAILAFACCCGGCFSLLTCCRARRHLLPNRYSYYGTIGDAQEASAGDV